MNYPANHPMNRSANRSVNGSVKRAVAVPPPDSRWRKAQAWLHNMTRRRLVLALLLFAAGGMVARASYLQLLHNDFLQDQGDDRYLRVIETPAHRGMIVDRNGEPLAVSSPVDSIWAQPVELLQQRDRWPLLAPLLEMTVAELDQKLAGKETRQFIYLRRHLAPSTAQQILQLKIPGVYARREYRRYYPDAEVTSHLLGFTDIDDAGQEGLEKAFDNQLRGVAGQKRVIKDRLGHIVEEVETLRLPQPGQRVTLSIDRRLQYLAYRALKATVLENKAAAASAVMLDVRTGNPNNRNELQGDLLRNRAATDVYEPGSTMKPFTICLALESGKWTPSTPVDARGPLRVGRYQVRDVHNYGVIDVTRVISKSSNVGTTKIAFSMPMERLWKLYKDVGFGTLSGLGLAGEQAGVLHHFSKWGGEIGHANHSFGYGLSVNMLQLAQAYGVLAADGVKRPLTLLKRDQPLDPAEEQRILSAQTVRQVRAMLELAVSKQGTGAKAGVPGYRVAGKTGTVHKIVNGRYASNRYFSLFAGMVPASQPRLVMVIIVDEPKGGAYYGGAVAAPVFGETMGEALRILNITPDDMPSMKIAGSPPPGTTP